MNPILIYMIKAAVYLAAFYIIFSLLLSRDTLYNRNRTFILLSVFSALILPFITIRTGNPVNLPFFGKTFSEVLVSGTSTGFKSWNHGEFTFSFSQIMMIIYLAGTLFFGCRLISELLELILMVIRKKTSENNIIRFSGLNTAGFSALGYVFINSKLLPEDAENIVKHEQNHIDHNHFYDLVFIEIVKVLQWFNPFIHTFDRSLRAVHEYQADEGCLNKGIPVISYQQLLMNQIFRSKAFSIINSFSNPTLIKKRMIMMTKERSKTLANLKLLMVLPVIAIVMLAFSSCGGKTKPAEPTTVFVGPPPPPPPPPSPSFNVQNGDTIWNTVEKMPVFSGNDAAIMKFIGENVVYPDGPKQKGIQGKVIVKFVVNEKGEIKEASIAQSVSPELDAEALRVINLLPKFESPGYQAGKPVQVWYMIPINFTLK